MSTHAPPAVLALIALPESTLDALRKQYALHHYPDGMPHDVPDAALIRAVVTNGSTGLSDAQMARLPALEIICGWAHLFLRQ